MTQDHLLDICWELFQHVQDTTSPSVVKACVELVKSQGFDVDELPGNLYDTVNSVLREDAIDSYAA